MNINQASHQKILQFTSGVALVSILALGIHLTSAMHSQADVTSPFKNWQIHAMDEEMILEWEVEGETKDFSHFIVERSQGLSSFSPIGQVAVISELENPTFLHSDPKSTTQSKYRLRVVMKDGREILSPVQKHEKAFGLDNKKEP